MPDSLRVVLHSEPSATFPPNSIIDGHVEVDIKDESDQQKLNQINVTFQGQSNTRITIRYRMNNQTSYRYYHGRSVLFYHNYTINQGRDFRPNDEGGTLMWPFQLQVPPCAEPVPQNVLEQLGADFFQPGGLWPGSLMSGQQPTPLPPPMNNYHHVIGNQTANADITYTCRVEVPGLSSGWTHAWIGDKSKEIDIPISSTTQSPSATQWPSLEFEGIVRSLRLLPDHQDGHLSFREHAKSLFHKSSLPSITLLLTFTGPDQLFLDHAPNEPLPFHLTVRRVTNPANTSPEYPDDTLPTPRVLLKKLELRLISQTDVRTRPGMLSGEHVVTGLDQLTFHEYRDKDPRENPSAIVLPVDDPYTGGSQPGDASFPIGQALNVTHGTLQDAIARWDRIPQPLPPGFETPNVVRRYGLEWDLKLEVAEEEVHWEPSVRYGTYIPVRLEREGGVYGGSGQGVQAPGQPLYY